MLRAESDSNSETQTGRCEQSDSSGGVTAVGDNSSRDNKERTNRVFGILFFRVFFVFFLSKKEERRSQSQHGKSTVTPFQEKDVSGVF